MILNKYTIETILVLLVIELVLGQYITPLQSISRKQNEPFAYLQPPPPVPVLNYNYQHYNNRVWKQQPRQQIQHQSSLNNYTNTNNDISFVQKVVRWFGFGGNNSPQKPNFKESSQKYPQQQQSQHQQQHQQPQQQSKFYPSQNVQYRGNNYNIPEIQSILPAASPSESSQSKNINGELATKGTGKCLPCNQIPWIPIFPFYQTPILINKHNVGGGDPRNQLTTPKLTTELPDDVETIPSIITSSPKSSTTVTGLTTSTTELPYDTEKLISLSTVQPNFYSHHQSFIHGLAPIPVPNLSATPLPPLYDAKSFLYNPYGSNFLKPFSKSESKSHHQKYKIEAVSDIISDSTSSPIKAATVQTKSNQIETHAPKFNIISDNFPSHLYKDLEITSDTDIEVIKSIPVAHFSTTVLQYPNSNNQLVHQQQSYGTNLGNIKHDLKVLNTLINDSIVNEPISIEDSKPAASNNQNFTVGSEIRFVRPEATTRDYTYDEGLFSETKRPTFLDSPAGVPDQIIYGKPNGVENTVSIPTPFAADLNENYQNTNRFSKSSSFNSTSQFDVQQTTKWTTVSPIQTTLYDEAKKKSKQIQIIIPYTVDRQKLEQYATVNYDNWNVRNSYQNDDYVHEETKTLYQTKKPELEKKNPKFLTKILASNLRELLKKEIPKSNKNIPFDESSKRPFFIDQAKLQMNIDDWTEQEFSTSNMEQKASTISFLVPSKIIPNEYLTTTPSTIPTTMMWSETVETSYEDDYTGEPEQEDNNLHRFVLDNKGDTNLWNKLGVTISPITHEKVHVITPLKLNAVNTDSTINSTNKLIETNFKNENQFKSPRFIVRPTPGSPTKGLIQLKSTLAYSINNLETTPASMKDGDHLPLLKPKLFGYMNYFSPLSELIDKEDDELSEKQRIQIVTPLSFIRRNNLDIGDENISN